MAVKSSVSETDGSPNIAVEEIINQLETEEEDDEEFLYRISWRTASNPRIRNKSGGSQSDDQLYS